ncbi:hypothetical protein R5R35_005628 [Gryllus longicercus]|uniref:Hairy n=1 Tax=Gryllus longicercus TaxID=2509291 RepID=A0AAN9VYZ3_9ORTH
MVTGGASVTAVAAAGPGAASAPAGGGCVPPGPDSALPPPRRPGENRRSNKPIMEKRRRARINNCLNELKSLILDAMKKDPARHSKLEKADILEMTVKHLETLQRQQAAMSAATDPAVVNKFRAGFSECAGEVGRFPGLESAVRRRLLQHLANCLNGSTASAPETTAAAAAPASTPASPAAGGTPAAATAVQVHILQPGSAAGALPAIAAGPNGGIFLATNGGPSLQLVPTRLPNGDIALVLPSANGTFRQSASATAQSSPSTSPVPSSSSSTSSSSPLPLLIPVPQRTASTASASSTSSGSSTSSASPVAFDRLSVASPPAPNVRPPSAALAPAHAPSPAASPSVPARPYSPPMQRPLSLVMRKTVDACSDEEKPWRPW